MFGRTSIIRSTGNYSDNIERLKKAIDEADAIVIGAGAGLSTSAGFTYPFWQMTAKNPEAVYACLNYDEAICPDVIKDQSILIKGDIWECL